MSRAISLPANQIQDAGAHLWQIWLQQIATSPPILALNPLSLQVSLYMHCTKRQTTYSSSQLTSAVPGREMSFLGDHKHVSTSSSRIRASSKVHISRFILWSIISKLWRKGTMYLLVITSLTGYDFWMELIQACWDILYRWYYRIWIQERYSLKSNSVPGTFEKDSYLPPVQDKTQCWSGLSACSQTLGSLGP